MADLSLTTRTANGSPLTTAQVDQNWTDIQTEVNADKDTSQNSNDKLIGSVAGTNTVTGTLTPTLTAYASGQVFTIVPAATNTGATTLNIDSLGAKNVFASAQACIGGEFVQNVPTLVEYDGTQFNVMGPANQVTVAGNQNVSGNKNFTGTTTLSGTVAVSGKVSGLTPPSGGTNIAAHTNLLIIAGTTPDEDVTITADSLVVADTSGNQKLLSSVSETDVANTTSGVGGLDTGSVASTTWYYIWIIHIDSSDTTNAVYSLSNSLSTVLTNVGGGYDMGGMVGAILTDGTSDNIVIRQNNKEVSYQEQIRDLTDAATTAQQTDAFSVPPNTTAKLGGFLAGTGTSYLDIRETWRQDTAASSTNFVAACVAGSTRPNFHITRRVNASSQLNFRKDTSGDTALFDTFGWEWD